MSTSELLLWLNDLNGKEVEAEILVERDDDSLRVMQAIGRLRHWSEDDWSEVERLIPASMRPRGPRDDLAGWYMIGQGVRLDVTEFGDKARFDGEEIQVEVAGPGVMLFVREHPPE